MRDPTERILRSFRTPQNAYGHAPLDVPASRFLDSSSKVSATGRRLGEARVGAREGNGRVAEVKLAVVVRRELVTALGEERDADDADVAGVAGLRGVRVTHAGESERRDRVVALSE